MDILSPVIKGIFVGIFLAIIGIKVFTVTWWVLCIALNALLTINWLEVKRHLE